MASNSSALCSYCSYANYSFKQDRLKKLPEIVAFADKLIDMVRKKGRRKCVPAETRRRKGSEKEGEKEKGCVLVEMNPQRTEKEGEERKCSEPW